MFLQFVQFAKVAALLAVAWTIFCVLLIVGWQASSWLTDGNWPALRLSSFIKGLRDDGDFVARAHGIESRSMNLLNNLLDAPAILPLLVASALLVTFYLWLTRIEKR